MIHTPCVCARLRRSARTVTALYDKAMSPSGLTVGQYSLLRTLEHAGPSTLTAFAALTGHDRTTLNRTLAPLQKAELIRSSTGGDQRARIVAITAKAEKALTLAEPYWREAQARVGEALGPDRKALFATLDRIEGLRS